MWGVSRRISGQQAFQVLAVGGLAELLDVGLEAGAVDPALREGDFLDAGDLQAGAVLKDVDELGGFDERVVRAGVEPGGATASAS